MLSLEDRAEQIICQSEAMKAKILPVPGKDRNLFPQQVNFDLENDFIHSAMVDEDYQVVAAHVDESLMRNIKLGEYIDFARLLPTDRILAEDNSRLEIVNKDGRTYFVPANSKELGSISSFFKWEQAFRVFSNIYTAKYPQKAVELIQYNHLINMASMTFTWENVYMYDKDYRMHLSRHPYRSWAIILQQAWTVRLKDRLRTNNGNGAGFTSGRNGSKGRKDICWRYNNGKCTYGSTCKFDHKCSVCLHFGHGMYNCRRANGGSKTESQRDKYYNKHHDREDRNRKWDKHEWRDRQK